MAYKTVYPCWVIDEIKRGRKIYVLDRKLRKCAYVNDATVQDVVKIIESNEDGRYEFWYEKKEVENG